jgi:transcriptional regulator with XRE-family HTH domain
MQTPPLDRIRRDIAAKIRSLRQDRRWTQAELATRLGLSQARLSQVERGDGSFTAEQLLAVMVLFNVTVDDFYAPSAKSDRNAALHNALARLGASHLAEVDDTAPSAQLAAAEDVVVETLVTASSPRQIAALAPVLVQQTKLGHIGLLRRIDARLTALGLERRFGWVVDNLEEAIRVELGEQLPREWSQLYRRANLVFSEFLKLARARRSDAPRDILDHDIRTTKSADHLQSRSSSISRAWGIVTSIQSDDFRKALRAARGAD